jgi:hypothetical protein
MNEYLQMQIANRRDRLSLIDKERALLIAELAAYEDALAHGSSVQLAVPKSHKGNELRVSKAWRAILQRLAEFRHFNASDVKLVAQELYNDGKLKKSQTNDGVRAQLSLYAKRGLVRRRGNGSYLLTEKTKAALLPSSPTLHDANQETKLAWARAGGSGPSHGG